MLDTWTRTDNLPYFLDDQFAYIREDAELLGEKRCYEVEEYVRKIFERDFALFFEDLEYDDVILVEYNLFEPDCCDKSSIFPGYAVYIHFHRVLVEKLIAFMIEEHPEYLLKAI